jgi:hypothetical protein
MAYILVALVSPDWVPLPDFAARWTAGRAVLDGQAHMLYDPAYQSALQATELGASKLSWFVSPPFVALLFAPFALMPYGLACAVWVACSIALLVACARLARPLLPSRLLGQQRRLLLILASAGPTLELVGGGQDTILVLFLVVAMMRLIEAHRGTAAGLVLGLGVIKPHLLALLVVLLLVRRLWRTLVGFAMSSGALVVSSVWLAGWEGLRTWATLPFGDLYRGEVLAGQAWKAVSLPSLATRLGPPDQAWWPLIGLLTTAVLIAFSILAFITSRSMSLWPAGWGIALLATLVSSPHAMLYDAVLAYPAVVALAVNAWNASTRVLLAALYVLLWLMAPLQLAVQNAAWPISVLAAPWAALPLAALGWALIRRQAKGGAGV